MLTIELLYVSSECTCLVVNQIHLATFFLWSERQILKKRDKHVTGEIVIIFKNRFQVLPTHVCDEENVNLFYDFTQRCNVDSVGGWLWTKKSDFHELLAEQRVPTDWWLMKSTFSTESWIKERNNKNKKKLKWNKMEVVRIILSITSRHVSLTHNSYARALSKVIAWNNQIKRLLHNLLSLSMVNDGIFIALL